MDGYTRTEHTFDGKTLAKCVSYSGDVAATKQNPAGSYSSKSEPRVLYELISAKAIALSIRPGNLLNAYAQQGQFDWKHAGTAVIDGHDCIAIGRVSSATTSPTSDQLEFRIWVDPDHNFIIRRAIRLRNGKPALEWLFTYRESIDSDSPARLVPTSWTWTSLSKNQIVRTVATAELGQIDLTPKDSDRTFTLRYPPGTFVRNLDTGERFWAEQDGTLRRDEPEQNVGETWPWARRAAAAISVIVIAALSVLNWWRSRTSTSSRVSR
jgi:hypothetical protein